MNPGRRILRFERFDHVMPDVENLLASGHATVGNWSLGQILHHLATVARRVVDLPASTPIDPSLWVGEERKREILASGLVPEGLPAPPVALPPTGLDPRAEAEGLRQAIAYYLGSPDPVVPHRFFGPLSRDEWDQFQRLHMAHHLSFAVPNPGSA